MSYPWESPDGTRVLYDWAFASRCNAGCPYCFSYAGYTAQAEAGARWWTDSQAVAAWAAVAEKYGEGLVVFTGLEPTNELRLVGQVLQYHKGCLRTNLACDMDELRKEVSPARASIQPSFHPHLWGMETGPFVARLQSLKADGYEVGRVVIVAWPPYIPRLAQWIPEILEVAQRVDVFACRGCTYQGRTLPEGYTQEERETLSQFVAKFYHGDVAFPPLKISSCGAGMATVCVMLDGSVWRCAQVHGMGDQNLMRDCGLMLEANPMPCDQESCRCDHLHVYHITDKGKAKT